MADYWRFPDRVAPGHGQVPLKRLRSEFDDMAPPPTGSYYPREEPRFDERDGRISWREPDSLGIGYGSGLAGASDMSGVGGAHHLGLSGQGAMNLGLSAHDDLNLIGQGRMLGMDKTSSIGIGGGRTDYLSRQDNQVPRAGAGPGLLPPDASATLFVEGLPSDCSRREAAHVFRPFLGFKEVRLVRKDVKRPGGEPLILCFVDFTDARCAATAMEALQGYKFDEMSRDSDTLRLQFARAPGPRGGRDDYRGGRDREDFPRGGGRPFRR